MARKELQQHLQQEVAAHYHIIFAKVEMEVEERMKMMEGKEQELTKEMKADVQQHVSAHCQVTIANVEI